VPDEVFIMLPRIIACALVALVEVLRDGLIAIIA
jgi:hypothetical protein